MSQTIPQRQSTAPSSFLTGSTQVSSKAGSPYGLDRARRSPSGLGLFVLGIVLTLAGAYLLASRVIVTTGFWQFYGYNAFGVLLLPLLIGVVLVAFSPRSLWGWLLSGLSLFVILLGVVTSLSFYFYPTSLLVTLVILSTLVAGLGLIARALLNR
ncbi:MAG: hypothetical protein HY329_18170 [Chloroflexi bacterium]|nr:hypothetical protein [Chloroflexota bacterium]